MVEVGMGCSPTGGDILPLDFFWFSCDSVESTESTESIAI